MFWDHVYVMKKGILIVWTIDWLHGQVWHLMFPLLTLNHSTESIQQRWNQKDWRRPWWTAAFRWALIARKHFSSAAEYILNILFFSHWSLGWDRWLPVRCAYTGRGPWSWLRWDERHGHRKEEKASTGASLWHGERTTILPCTQSSDLAVRIRGEKSCVMLWNKKKKKMLFYEMMVNYTVVCIITVIIQQ